MNRERVIGLLGEDWLSMKRVLKDFLLSDVDLISSTNSYVLDNAGKMLRPMLCLLMARACGKMTMAGIHYAAACEMLHNATLLHDDVADQSPQRRGRPTVASMLGPSSAVLLGDFWLSRAVDTVLSAEESHRVVELFSHTLQNLAEGEMLQLQKAGSADTSFDDYFRIIFCKTASLFEVCGLAGAVSAEASEKMKNAAKEYSGNLGMAFQIRDDILDYSGDASLGKPVGVDLKEKKITLPLLCALEGDPREEEIRRLVREMDENPSNEEEIRKFVKNSQGEKKAAAILEDYVTKAVRALDGIPDSEEKSCLSEIAEYNIIRTI